MESLSLKLSLFIHLSFLFFSFPPSHCLVQDGLRACPFTCHMSNFSLALRIFLILLSIYLGFPSNHVLPHVHVGPTLELKLTNSVPDMWHTVSHSKCAKSPTTLVASKNMQISTISEFDKFDVIARFRETIPTVKFVLSSEI